ncbi:hypothetical protein ILUMI_25045 [Ignelater luminosus]|uniref:DUF229 domain containing protein n=1 Tax=Ignelater luminosus TaxID=2038154 RepID=A0A8K0C818_IGNLU|nr:hypothetical protein ILUMI_25045 [Ignelater luminosus]
MIMKFRYGGSVLKLRRLLLEKRMDGDETRWRPPSVLFVPLLLCGGLIFFVDVFQLQSFGIPTATISLPQPRFVGFPENYNLKGFLIKTEGCRIPDMEAFDASIKEYIYDEDHIACNNDTPPLVESNLTHLYLLRTSLADYGVSDISALKCCYSEFRRKTPTDQDSDNKFIINKTCIGFNETARINKEYVKVTCFYNGSEIYKDLFAFVPIKPEVKSLKSKSPNSFMNVLIIGVDAVSRLNLHRQMPKTVQILKDINAIEFLGYNKVGDNTFPNLVPVLTGMSEKELVKNCWPSKNARFDDCPFIWKNFSEYGYATAFAEDAAWMGIFNYVKRGFKEQPTNYYWGPFNYMSEREIGNEHKMNAYMCVGSRMVYKTLLEYVNKFVRSMHINKIPYFGFFWGASLSHDYLNKPKLGDNDYAKFLNELRTNGLLNHTALVFMSDHGIRWGGIRTTYQGRMEERLPFLFISLPPSYQEIYYQTYINLRRNSRRLTTPYDLHETLKDLLDPYALTSDILSARIQAREDSRGYSLFEPIPTNRTCDSAGIASHWCTCQQSVSVDKSDHTVVEAAKFTVEYINDKLEGYADCANLTLAEIYNARLHSSGEHVLVGKNYTQDYTVAFRTTPGDANFEATIRQHLSKGSAVYFFTITGTISRINLYGKQSLCITDFHLKLYCYCKT